MASPELPTTGARLILPPAEFATDEEMFIWFETVRKTGLKLSDVMEEGAGYIFNKLRRYAMRHGVNRWAAYANARAVSLPVARAAESFVNVAAYMHVARNRLEAYIDAVTPPPAGEDFKVTRGG